MEAQTSSPVPGTRTLLFALPVAAALFCSLPALEGRFTNDDDILIINNPYAHGFEHLWENLTGDYFYSASAARIGYYRPATKLLFLLEYQLFGASPRGYHAVSVALFAVLVLLVLLLFLRLGVPEAVAAGAALLFATNPAHAEPVAIITAQSDLLSACFVVAALILYLRWRDGRRPRLLALAAVAVGMALLAKESGVVAPLLVAVNELARARLRLGELKRQAALSWLALPVVLYIVLRLSLDVMPIARPGEGGVYTVLLPARTGTMLLLRALAPGVFAPYLHMTRPAGEALQVLIWGAPLALTLIACGYAATRWEKARWAGLLLAVPLLPLLPGSVVHVTGDPRLHLVPDRWVMLPAVGAGLVLGLSLAWASGRLGRLRLPAAVVFFGALALPQGLQARLEHASFHDEATRMSWVGRSLAERGDLSPPEREMALAARAVEHDRKGERRESVRIYRRLSRLAPHDHNRRFNLAVSLMEAGEPREALYHALTAFHGESPDGKIRLRRDDSFNRNRPNRAYLVGLLLDRLGQGARAKRYFRICLELNPSHVGARRRLTK